VLLLLLLLACPPPLVPRSPIFMHASARALACWNGSSFCRRVARAHGTDSVLIYKPAKSPAKRGIDAKRERQEEERISNDREDWEHVPREISFLHKSAENDVSQQQVVLVKL